MQISCSDYLVVDTNIFSHAENPGAVWHESAFEVVQFLEGEKRVSIVLDDTGKTNPELATSRLASEYMATCRPDGLAMVLFAHLLASDRVVFADRPGRPDKKKIEQLLPNNVNDRAVLGAALDSRVFALVTNDYDDFHDEVRVACKAHWSASVIDSDQATA